ncbi:hypothetical protein DRH27_02475 [Candidatus Falkowbacteria bacterium]|nr:MAG: hypothetical protein DRH27_02475 [Candidatus Falkowbacteria bacterium]
MKDKKDVIFMFPGTFNKGSECFKVLAKSFEKHYDCRPFDYSEYFFKFNEKPIYPQYGFGMNDQLLQCGQEICTCVTDELEEEQKIILLGHSKGALYAAWLAQWIWAAGYGHKIKAVIMIAPAAPGEINNFSFSGFWALKSVLISALWGSLVKRSFWGTCWGVLNGLNLSLEEKYLIWKNLYWEPRQVFLDLISPPKINLKKVNCPKLVVGGTKDRLVPPIISKMTAHHYRADHLEIDMPHYMLDSLILISNIMGWLKIKKLL